MAKNNYQIVCDLSRSFFIDSASSRVPVIAGKETIIRDQVAGDSFALSLHVYDDYDADVKHDFGASATAKLYIKERDSESDPYTIDAAGTVTQSAAAEYDTVDFDVDAGAVPASLGNKDCVIYAEITASTEQVTLVQYISIFGLSGAATLTPSSEDVAGSIYQVVAKTTAPGTSDDSAAGYAVGDYIWHSTGSQLYKATSVAAGAAVWATASAIDSHAGTAYYLCDTTAADVTVALPSGQAGEIAHVKNDSGSNSVTISGTIKNTTTITLDAADDAILIRSNAAATWLNLNFDTIIR